MIGPRSQWSPGRRRSIHSAFGGCCCVCVLCFVFTTSEVCLPLSCATVSTGSHEFPLEFGAEVPNAARMEETWSATQKVFDSSPKVTVQGGSTEGGGGSVRYFTIPDHVDSSQVVLWSRDIGKRTVKCKIEVLQGPNSVRQLYDLHCGGSTQPYHAIIPTPGPGWTIRIIATNYMEFPFEAVVTPYEQFQDSQGGFNAAGPQSYDLGSGDWYGSDRTTAGAHRW